MLNLFLVPKPAPESDREGRAIAAGPLQQLAAIDRAIERLHQARVQFSNVIDLATRMEDKLHAGTETFLAAWNTAHPEHLIQRCRGAARSARCARFTSHPQALCDACRAPLASR